MHPGEFFEQLKNPLAETGLGYFTPLPDTLLPDIAPSDVVRKKIACHMFD